MVHFGYILFHCLSMLTSKLYCKILFDNKIFQPNLAQHVIKLKKCHVDNKSMILAFVWSTIPTHFVKGI